MNQNKSFSDEDITLLAKKFKILSEPSRLLILRSLMKQRSCVIEITLNTKLLQSNVSKQLKALEKYGIVECIPIGRKRYYKIIDHTIIDICNRICQDKEE